MQKIAFTIGQASQIAVGPINADATTGSVAGNASVFAGVVIAKSGKPNTVLSINADNFKNVLGEPYRPLEGAHFESMRHVAIAVKGGNGYVVRVPLPGMKVPAINLVKKTLAGGDGEADTVTIDVTTSATLFGSDIELPEGGVFTLYVDDGHKSDNRSLSFVPVTGKAGFYTLTLKSTDSMGTVTTLEEYEVSLDPLALSDMGVSAFLHDVLENNESKIQCVLADDAMLPVDFAGFKGQAFVGGDDGDVSKLTAESYDAPITALENSLVEYTAILTLGVYDATVIEKLATLAKDVRVDAFGDVDPRLSATKALEQMTALGLNGNENITLYYFPYSCRDPLGQTKVVFGLSGDAFVAKAKGVALVADVGGWHYSPAGAQRGMLTRQNIKPLASAGSIDRELFAKAHLNVVSSYGGGVVIDDALTACTENNYKKYQHVVSVTNAIARSVYALGLELKHQPDGITREGWEKGLPNLLDRYVASEALVTPSDTSEGDQPYVVTVEKLDFDYWQISYSLSITGVGRRTLLQPILFR
ncbi:phage tail protein [Pantoea sp. LMR881]|uniref:phage tail protein n=1 Tax=Pantoea sp. LMR881 TaxID=3014336 RepID=UPI0022AF52BF|nr:phage tail protein [Pantoea sp. LMR881]MCZ4061260.1 phage tail protein [Pantoea sp. LMR881]